MNGAVQVLDLEPGSNFVDWTSCQVDLADVRNKTHKRFDLIFGGLEVNRAFATVQQVRRFLSEVTSHLLPGGCFVGMLLDTNELMQRIDLERRPQNRRFDNSFLHLNFSGHVAMSPVPLFGAEFEMKMNGDYIQRYHLVHLPAFKKMASAYGLTLHRVARYEDIFHTHLEEGS